LADGTGAKGDYYVVSTAGTQTFDGVQLFFGLGDWIVYNGAVWQRVEGGSDGNFSNVTLTSTDAGAAASPLLELYRDSASPAASDTLGEIEFNGEDSAGNKQAYGLIHASILSPTSTAEQGQIHFETATAGALTEKMIIGTTNLVINEIGAVYNVRIESDGDANLFFTDGTNNRIGVGTGSPDAQLTVNTIASFGAGAVGTPSIAAKGDLNTGVWFPAADTIAASTGGSERIRLDSSGNLLVGTTSSILSGLFSSLSSATAGSFRISADAAAGIVLDVSRTAASGDMVYFRTGSTDLAGFISCPTSVTTTYNSVSDYRLKENVTPMTGALAKVAALNPVTYTWKTDGSNGQGFIAHELQAVVPDCVTGEKDAVQTVDDLDVDGNKIGTKEAPRYQGVDTSFLVATLVAAIQEQQALITQLQADVSALKGN
jgi:hypothetical protein